jgi:hypothetical protein
MLSVCGGGTAADQPSSLRAAELPSKHSARPAQDANS